MQEKCQNPRIISTPAPNRVNSDIFDIDITRIRVSFYDSDYVILQFIEINFFWITIL